MILPISRLTEHHYVVRIGGGKRVFIEAASDVEALYKAEIIMEELKRAPALHYSETKQ